jgi:hypothetical protein
MTRSRPKSALAMSSDPDGPRTDPYYNSGARIATRLNPGVPSPSDQSIRDVTCVARPRCRREAAFPAKRGIFVRSKLPLRIGKRCKRLVISTRLDELRTGPPQGRRWFYNFAGFARRQ